MTEENYEHLVEYLLNVEPMLLTSKTFHDTYITGLPTRNVHLIWGPVVEGKYVVIKSIESQQQNVYYD